MKTIYCIETVQKKKFEICPFHEISTQVDKYKNADKLSKQLKARPFYLKESFCANL